MPLLHLQIGNLAADEIGPEQSPRVLPGLAVLNEDPITHYQPTNASAEGLLSVLGWLLDLRVSIMIPRLDGPRWKSEN